VLAQRGSAFCTTTPFTGTLKPASRGPSVGEQDVEPAFMAPDLGEKVVQVGEVRPIAVYAGGVRPRSV
jgi:hypothetical protein